MTAELSSGRPPVDNSRGLVPVQPRTAGDPSPRIAELRRVLGAVDVAVADVRSLVLKEGVVLALVGVLCGLALSAWVGHALRHQLYGISPLDAASVGAAAVILAGAALLASWLPARRAARVDPIVALRES